MVTYGIPLVGGFSLAFFCTPVGDGPAVLRMGCQPVIANERFEFGVERIWTDKSQKSPFQFGARKVGPFRVGIATPLMRRPPMFNTWV